MLGAMRRLVGTFALVALLTSPTVSQVRFFCRYTGVEITDCDEQQVSEHPVVQREGCCERRVSPAPAPAKVAREHALPQAMAVALAWAQHLPVQPLAPSRQDRLRLPPDNAAPPLFLQQRALLI
jgi:hypothetical protein